MASERMCPHTITLFNFIGEDADGRASYSATILKNVHVRHKEGIGSTDAANDSTKVHIFDDTYTALPPDGQKIDRTLFNLTPFNLIQALNTPADEKPFVPYEEFSRTTDREQYWSLSAEGKDYFALGEHQNTGDTLPGGVPLFRIISVSRRQIGRKRMWHWRIEAR